MLVIRFARVGKKNRAQFQIVLQERIIAPGGRHVEVLGSYDPHSKATVLKEERIKYWISKGAQASPTVHNLLVAKNVISGKKVVIKVPKKKVEPAPAEAKAETKTEKETKPEEPKEEVKAEEKSEEPKKEEKAEEVKEAMEEKAEEKKEEKKEEEKEAK